MERAGIPLPPGFQAHHLIPDEVARTHPLAQAARARGAPPWDVDGEGNGLALPGSPELAKGAGLPVHWGSHPAYSRYTREQLDQAERLLVRQYGSLDRAPPEAQVQTMKTLEQQLQHSVRTDPKLRSPEGRLY